MTPAAAAAFLGGGLAALGAAGGALGWAGSSGMYVGGRKDAHRAGSGAIQAEEKDFLRGGAIGYTRGSPNYGAEWYRRRREAEECRPRMVLTPRKKAPPQ